MKILYAIILVTFIFSACNSNKAPKDAKIVQLGTKTQTNNNIYSIADFSFQVPDNWKKENPSSNMRIAQFSLKDHPEYQVVVSYFGDMDNMIKANIDRWKNQFSNQESYMELALDVNKLTAIKILGTYKLKPFPMAQEFKDTPNYGTLAAIVPSSEGPYFIKLTAPKEIIEEQEKIFIGTLNSYLMK